MDFEQGFPYRLLAKLPNEPLSEVYDAVLQELPVYRRVKILRPELSLDAVAPELFAVAARFAASIRHPSVAAPVGYGKLPDGRPFLAFEAKEGCWLEEWLRQNGRPNPKSLDIFLRALAPGLAALHGAEVVLGSLSGRRIFLEGGCITSPVFSSLESVRYPGAPLHPRAHGEFTAATKSSDIYMLGGLLMKLMGAPLPSGEATPQLPPGYERLLPIVDRCLQQDPADRFEDGGELARMLAGEPANTSLEGIFGEELEQPGPTRVRADDPLADLFEDPDDRVPTIPMRSADVKARLAELDPRREGARRESGGQRESDEELASSWFR